MFELDVNNVLTKISMIIQIFVNIFIIRLLR